MDASLPKGNQRAGGEMTSKAGKGSLLAEIKPPAQAGGGPSAGYGIRVPKA
jgi:hypothetical protein